MNRKSLAGAGLGIAVAVGVLYLAGFLAPLPKPEDPADPAVASSPAPTAAPEAPSPPAEVTTADPAPAAPPPEPVATVAQDAPDAAPAPALPEPQAGTEVAQPTVTAAGAEASAPAPVSTPERPGAVSEVLAATGPEARPDPDAPLPLPNPPSFDLVRADPTGQTLVAGRAEPGAAVAVLVDGIPEPEVQSDRDGRFTAFLDLPLDGAPRVLRLRLRHQGRELLSEQEVILTPPAAPPPAAMAAAEPAADAPAPDSPAPTPAEASSTPAQARSDPPAAPDAPEPRIAAAPGPSSPDAAAAAVVPAPEAPAPVALLSSEAGIEVMQPQTPLAQDQIAIDTISYDEQGAVALAGRGRGAASVRVYLDNRPLITTRIAADGRWQAALPDVATGTYTLRVDQIDDAGEVTARAESPFRRESAEVLAAAADPAVAVRAVTVQPGHMLWAIARTRYGQGIDYVKVFEANRSQIRNPDLIYPGQVFDIPD